MRCVPCLPGFRGQLPLRLLGTALQDGRLTELRLKGNSLEYPVGSSALTLLTRVVSECSRIGSNSVCEGLPPVSCAAFGVAGVFKHNNCSDVGEFRNATSGETLKCTSDPSWYLSPVSSPELPRAELGPLPSSACAY